MFRFRTSSLASSLPRAIHAGAALALLGSLLAPTQAAATATGNVISIGDSLVNLFGTDRGPIVAELLATRLGVSNTNFFTANLATTQAVVNSGAHTSAAASFGSGDLAVLWFGGNDFGSQGANIAGGNFSFLAQSEANYDIVLNTLRNGGLDVMILNLFDVNLAPSGVSQIPAALRPMFRAATEDWNGRLQALAASHGAAYVDVFSLFDAINSDPTAYSILGVDPLLAPVNGCDECLFFDQVHISTLGQAYAANAAIAAFNSFFDPGGTMPLTQLSQNEIGDLANIPEPGTGSLFGLGLGVIALRRRRSVDEGRKTALRPWIGS